MSYKIIVDSCCDLTDDMKAWDNLIAIPLTLELGDYSIKDDNNFDQDDFISRMKAYEGTARSACPSPNAFYDAIKGDEEDIYLLTITDKLSGCYNSALQGKELFEDEFGNIKNIHVFNSLATSGLETIFAREIKKLADEGKPFNEVVKDVEDLIQNRSGLYFCLESLDALKNNGRLFSLAATVIQKLRVKLICKRSERGDIGLAGQDFATNRAITKMCDHIANDVSGRDISNCTAIITYVCCPDKANLIAGKLEERCSFGKIEVLKASGLNSLYASDGGVLVSYSK